MKEIQIALPFVMILTLTLLATSGCATNNDYRVSYKNKEIDTTATYTPTYRDRVKTGITEMRVRNLYRCYKIKRENGGRGRCSQ